MSRTLLSLILLFAVFSLCAQDRIPPDRLAQLRKITNATVHGFLDYRYGHRTQHDDYEDETILNEARLQLNIDSDFRGVVLKVRGDLFYDETDEDSSDVDLERGEGWFDLREANVLFSPLAWIDVKAGRQILTWGTGDFLFINDLFPKDWVSFFSGRDQEYLKAPSDAVLLSMFPGPVDIYIAYTPRFDPDRYITGERISYFNTRLGRRAGVDAVQDPIVPDQWGEDDETAIRVAKNIEGYELSAYFYDGFWKSPAGMDPVTMRPTFPRLRVGGASIRGLVGKGIGNIEVGYYYSRDDKDGDDPFVRNSETRVLVGYQREMGQNLTVGLQYYLEYMQDHRRYEAGLAPGVDGRDRARHVTTISITKLLMNQDLRLSLFAYYSPSDEDAFVRPNLNYRVNDSLQVTLGANIFGGNYEHTFFGQFEHNSNVYVGARYSF